METVFLAHARHQRKKPTGEAGREKETSVTATAKVCPICPPTVLKALHTYLLLSNLYS